MGVRGFYRVAASRMLAVCLALPLPAAAFAATGIRDLDEPAITVKAPAQVELIAITQAGGRLVAVGEHGVIIYSDDDGLHWRQASVPVNVLLTAVGFASPSSGWAVGQDGVILRSDDGGASWRMQLDGIQVNQLTLAAAQRATAAHDAGPAVPLALRRAEHFLAGGPNIPFLSVLAIDANHGFAFGAYRLVMKTDDGGRSWQDWSLHVGDPLSHNLYDAAMVGGDICLAAETGLVFCSADGGASFPQVAAPASATLFGMLATGAGGMLAYGVAGECERGAPGGGWTSVEVGTQTNLTAGLVLQSGALILASEAGTLYVSHDHGNSFQRLAFSVPMAIYGLAQAADGDVIAVGDLGVARIAAANFNPG